MKVFKELITTIELNAHERSLIVLALQKAIKEQGLLSHHEKLSEMLKKIDDKWENK